MTRTQLGALWAAGARKTNGRIKFGSKILPALDVVRVAVDPCDDARTLQFTGYWSWDYSEHVAATPDQKELLCVLFEAAGNAQGVGFQRGPLWQPSLEQFIAFVKPYLDSGRLWGIELSNEFGIVAQGAERTRRFAYLLDLAEKFTPWLADNYPGVTLVMGGLHGIERWLAGDGHSASFNSYVVANGTNRLRNLAYLDVHTFDYTVSEARQRVAEIRAKGWECIFGEEFRQSGRDATFTGSERMVALAVELEIPLVCVFSYFGREDWGHNPATRANTEFLGVTGPGSNIRKGDPGEPDHLAELLRCAEIVRGEAPVPVPGGCGDRLVAITADRQQKSIGYVNRADFKGWRGDYRIADAHGNETAHGGERFRTEAEAWRYLEGI